MNLEEIKERLGEKAASLIKDGMVVALGSGTTAAFFIENLAKKCRIGLNIKAVASSQDSLALAKKNKISLIDDSKLTHIDIMVDGADEVDPHKRLIKGRGGALLREKILASASKERIIIIDESKLVKNLGRAPLPVEIVPFGKNLTEKTLLSYGYKGVWRTHNEKLLITENGNLIFDIHFTEERQNPEKDHLIIKSIPGVVETGFFFNLADKIIVGFNNGKIEIKEKSPL